LPGVASSCVLSSMSEALVSMLAALSGGRNFGWVPSWGWC
jgi:hypothetical protein